VFSNFEITGVYGNWYNARNEKLKEEMKQLRSSINSNHTLDLFSVILKF
jgi:hypothetical protein